MSNAFVSIDLGQLARVSGGAITAARDARTAADRLDAITPDQVNLQLGPVGAGWNVPERPFNKLLDHFGYPQAQPQPAGKPGLPQLLRGAAANSVG